MIDTGAILAFLDKDDTWHRATLDAMKTLRFPLATTAAVLAEVFHFSEGPQMDAAWAFVRTGGIRVLAIEDADLPDLEALMKRYADRPMDFADATLVHLAGRESLATILTIDHDDFETYRFGRGKKFRIVPRRDAIS